MALEVSMILKKKRALLLAFVCFAEILSGCGFGGAAPLRAPLAECEYKVPGEDMTQAVKANGGTVLLENGGYRLTADGEGVFKVLNTADETVWSTAAPESVRNSFSDDASGSSVALTYQSGPSAVTTVSSYGEAVQKGQFRVSREGDTVYFEQILGQYTADMLLPEALTEKRMAEVLAQMDELSRGLVERSYLLVEKNDSRYLEAIPNLKDQRFHVLMELPENRKLRIQEMFETIGYTTQDMAEDREAAGIQDMALGTVFKITTEFRLTENGLETNIPCDQIYFPQGMPILSMQLMKYGNFASHGAPGYYFIPSGSGALFEFSDEKEVEYDLQYYGQDYASESVVSDYSGYPVYGYTRGDGGYLAVIEEGAENIRLRVENVLGGYVMYPDIYLRERMTSALGGVMGAKFDVCAPEAYTGNIRISYSFYEEDDFDYSDMASAYREYLKKGGFLAGGAVSDTPPFLMEVVNSLLIMETKSSITTSTEKTVTSFDKTREMAEYFSGIENLTLKLSGSNKGGLYNQAPGKFKVSDKAGGKEKFNVLAEYCKQQGIALYQSVSLPFAYGAVGGYSGNKQSARMLNKKNAGFYYAEKSIGENRTDLPLIEAVSPNGYTEYAKKYIKNSALLSGGIAIGEFGRMLNSDFSEKEPVSRTEALEKTLESLEILQGAGSLTGENPNVYALRYMDSIEKLPSAAERFEFFEKSVPFLPMLLHGSKDYTGDVSNSTSDSRYSALYAIETGGGLAYRFADSIESKMLDGIYSYLFSANFELWKETALENYRYVNSALSGLNKVPIADHEFLSETLVKVTYENGVKIYVNYGRQEAKADGVTVPARDYHRAAPQ
jgi:hypothetical protein